VKEKNRMQKPKILNKSNKEIGEAGCCFTSCGGMPAVLQYKSKTRVTEKKLEKIK